jgi:hypothetical protein
MKKYVHEVLTTKSDTMRKHSITFTPNKQAFTFPIVLALSVVNMMITVALGVKTLSGEFLLRKSTIGKSLHWLLKEHAYLELLWEGEYYDDILFLVCNMSAF